MTRRVLLIDSDITFRTTLTVLLQRFRIEVVHEPDADEAIATGATQPPILVVVGVEEPEKAGFKIFQRLKKGPLSKIPIMLVTSSVSAESFAKHKGLKTHAESYVDKKATSKDLLLARLAEVIDLGEMVDDDDLDIPVEVDDNLGGDGGVILDEEAPPEDVFETKTVMGGPDKRVDASVNEDVDDAFAGLMGGDDAPSLDSVKPTRAPTPAPIPEVAPVPELVEPIGSGRAEFDELPRTRSDPDATLAALRAEKITAPPPIAEGESTSVGASIPSAGEGVPAVIEETAQGDDFGDFAKRDQAYAMDDVISSQDMIPVATMAAEAEKPVEQVDEKPEPEARPAILESQPAIMLDADDLEVLSDGDIVVEDEEEDSGGVPEPVPHPRSADDAAEAAAAREQEKSKPRFIASTTQAGVTSSPSIDLGLDKIADDARQEQESGGFPAVSGRPGSEGERSEHSGVYDRRALRKIGELERQVAQLKTELERSRALAETAAKGGGREQTFLNLREKMMASDNELKKVRADFTKREGELADLQAKLHNEKQARQDVEATAAELEKKLSAETSRSTTFDKKEQALASQVSSLEGDLAQKTEALTAAEAARQKLEAELTSERAMRAASASDAERQLRVEREQMVARHQGELGALRQEMQTRQDAALEQLREDLVQQQGAAVAAAIEATRNDVGAEAEDAIAQLEAQRENDIGILRSEQAQALAKAARERDEEIAKTKSDAEQRISTTTMDFEAKLARTQSDLKSELEAARAALETTSIEHNHKLAQQAAAHAEALEQQANEHAEAMQARERELTTARQDDAIAHTAALAELKVELDKTIAQHGIKLDGAKRELDELMALHEQNKAEIESEQASAYGRIREEHRAELERVEADKQRATEDIGRAAAEHKAATDRLAEQHRAELTTQREAADREISELRQVIVGAKRQLDETVTRLQAERTQLEKQHDTALSEQVAQHERAMAVANGEIVKVKAVADSEHNRTVAGMKADHERVMKERESAVAAEIKDLTTERDELQRGLSGARETIKRSENELASAVQTIADRNAESRSAQQAITERDQRIAELRKEVEAIEQENANYQEQVLRAYQKIKADEATVARAKKAMAIALTVLDDQGTSKPEPT